eukprot:5831630-Lingulodinium_polyedra.AAC.1
MVLWFWAVWMLVSQLSFRACRTVAEFDGRRADLFRTALLSVLRVCIVIAFTAASRTKITDATQIQSHVENV